MSLHALVEKWRVDAQEDERNGDYLISSTLYACAAELSAALAGGGEASGAYSGLCPCCGELECDKEEPTPAQAGAELPEPAVTAWNVSSSDAYNADQMREMYRRGLKDGAA